MTDTMRTWTTVDKTAWPEGPWTTEPDKVTWIDEATALDCMIHRGPTSILCGYVGVAEDHPWFGRGYDEVEGDVDVHGGLTFAGLCNPAATEASGICHIPAPGRPDEVWWLGFDCGHYMDLVPKPYGVPELDDVQREGTYKTLDFVRAEVLALAAQIKAAS